MKVLVIDDSKINRLSAVQTLAEHELTVVGNYDEAVSLLSKKTEPYWDAVLSDLLMPAGRDAQGPDGYPYVGQLMPVGFSLALLAALNGAKYVAVVTATNHHNHPASAMLDRLGRVYWHDEQAKSNFVINGARALFVHHPIAWVQGTTCGSCQGSGKGDGQAKCWSCNETGLDSGKDWGRVLVALTRD